jgi:transposase
MWTEITRPKYELAGRRHASDLTDAEWRLIEPYMPAVKRVWAVAGKATLRAIVDAILYIARAGCQWRLLRRTFRHSPRCKPILRLAGPGLVRADQF